MEKSEGRAARTLTGVHFMLGNHAVVEGALAAGCDFFAGYPITPANEISEHMARRLPRVGGAFLQGEDELASIYAVTSASLAGAKAMTATASAGYNYFQEGLEYAIAIEAPCVLVDVQRCRGENFATQADVMQLRWGAAGDHELIVLAPASVQELFDYTVRAFNLAEQYRNPVVVMSETTIALMRERLVIPAATDLTITNRRYTSLPPGEYQPFAPGADGVPEMAPLGQGYAGLYSINPHHPDGDIGWDPGNYERLYRRLTGKIRDQESKISLVEPYLLDDAEIALVAYGSEARPARDAVEIARSHGLKVGLLKLCTVWPVPETALRLLAKQVRLMVTVEMNIGKYAGEVERVAGRLCATGRITKNRGLVHTAEEVWQSLLEVLAR